MDYVLKAEALTKIYGHHKALDNFSMHIPKGAIYGLVGKNGAGKTTLLRLICGLQEATSGDYTLYGVSSRKHEILNARKEMGAVIETPAIYLDMSATGNLKEQYRILGIRSFDTIPELLKMVGLGNTGRKKAKNFSLGMRQRLGIAIALVGNPRFLVLDEPINGLDPQGIIEMRQLLLNLNQQYGMTILVSSHILDELSRLATHYGFIDNGKMIKEISASDLENSFRKSVRIEVTDGKALAAVLEQTGQPYKILAPNVIEVYNRVNISHLTADLEKYQCDVLSIQEREENLENYYVNLIGGISHE
ncbi:ATP-binding cassette domain-containing protein [Mediterraneibacter agrestimuris]|uniref:ATP-binding cassette domain-containing protein n=1 Tax=Mediterraneibacter agrestimuris TaxID=2941333 RepID=UPI00203AE4DB|nr:ATP-binding cassette domain-containing protein [Mediterraneibacter agrestimuris]